MRRNNHRRSVPERGWWRYLRPSKPGADGWRRTCSRDEFEVLDNGRPIEITVFSNEPQPLTAVVMLDLSGSMFSELPPDPNLAAPLHRHAAARRPHPDRQFRSRSGLSHKLTGDHDVLRGVVQEEPIWDGVNAALEGLAKEEGRRSIVLHSDGLSTGDRVWREDVLRSAAVAGVSIVVVAPPGFKADAQLIHAAKTSGGDYLLGYARNQRDKNNEALRAAFQKALDHLHRPGS